jgi:hypothetical protein
VRLPRPLRTVPHTHDRWEVHSEHGASHTVTVTRQQADEARAESCIKDPIPWQRLSTSIVE